MALGGFRVRVSTTIIQNQHYAEPVPLPASAFTDVTQFADLRVSGAINEGRKASVTLSMFDPVVADLEPYGTALRIDWAPPDLELVDGECVFFGQANVVWDFAAATVVLEGFDPVARLQHHYFRRGDKAWWTDDRQIIGPKPDYKGYLYVDHRGIWDALAATVNLETYEEIPVAALGLNRGSVDTTNDRKIGIERGQELWAAMREIVDRVDGPDLDICPNFTEPPWSYYAWADCYTPSSRGGAGLGRDLTTGLDSVSFEYGVGLDNVENFTVTPQRPSTHVHVLDRDVKYRRMTSDRPAASAYGVWMDWISSDIHIGDGDTEPLNRLADARVRAYAEPVMAATVTLRPVQIGGLFYGHPEGYVGGHWYLGDRVKFRAKRGHIDFSGNYRITAFELHQEGTQGTVIKQSITVVPVIGRVPVEDDVDV